MRTAAAALALCYLRALGVRNGRDAAPILALWCRVPGLSVADVEHVISQLVPDYDRDDPEHDTRPDRPHTGYPLGGRNRASRH